MSAIKNHLPSGLLSSVMPRGRAAALLFCFLLCGCYADEGNYDYHDVDDVLVDTTGTGILANYALTRFDVIDLEPNVYYNGSAVTDADGAPLTYLWTIFSAATGAGISSAIDTIGHERHLVAPITRTGGNYFVQLTVTNTLNGLREFFRVRVDVAEAFDGGWMVFYERADRPGYSDLALVLNPWTKNNYTADHAYTNLFELSNATFLPGHPVRCFDIAMSLSGHNAVGLCTDQTLVGVADNNLEQVLGFGNYFNKPPAEEAPTWYSHHGNGVMSGQSSEVLINAGKVYTNTYFTSTTGSRESRFGVAKFDQGVGTLAAWNAEMAQTLNYGVVVYDQTNRCFRYTRFESAQFETFAPQDMETAAFDVNATGMTLLMGDWGTGVGRMQPYDYLIMTDGSAYRLAVANFSSSTPEDENIGVALYDMTTLCPEVVAATTMAASNIGSYIYYAAGRTLYNFAYDSGLPATEAWTAPGTNEVITCVRIMKYYNTLYNAAAMPGADALLHIATWDAQSRQGHLYQYRINTASGILDTDAVRDYDIPGRVQDMAWKFSM